jgi:hypothetical protein
MQFTESTLNPICFTPAVGLLKLYLLLSIYKMSMYWMKMVNLYFVNQLFWKVSYINSKKRPKTETVVPDNIFDNHTQYLLNQNLMNMED